MGLKTTVSPCGTDPHAHTHTHTHTHTVPGAGGWGVAEEFASKILQMSRTVSDLESKQTASEEQQINDFVSDHNDLLDTVTFTRNTSSTTLWRIRATP